MRDVRAPRNHNLRVIIIREVRRLGVGRLHIDSEGCEVLEEEEPEASRNRERSETRKPGGATIVIFE